MGVRQVRANPNPSPNPNQAIPHSRAAVAVSQYLANFFVDECRASAHRFASPTDQWEQLIYHSPQWLAQPTLFSPAFVESYVFGSSKYSKDT